MIVLNRISEATCFPKYGAVGSNLSEGTYKVSKAERMIFHKNNVEIKLSDISTGGGQGHVPPSQPLLHLLPPAIIGWADVVFVI